MMARYSFDIAGPDDDAQLRSRLAENHMGEGIRLSFRREPCYFDACSVQGDKAQVIKCTDGSNGRIVGLGARFSLRAYINGGVSRVGYLADLRGEPAVRRGTLLARGYQYLRTLHDAAPLNQYFTLILSNNHNAVEQLASRRAGLPAYHHHGRFLSPALHLDLPKPAIKMAGLQFKTADASTIEEVFAFIQRQYAKKQLAPYYESGQLGLPRLKGLSSKDIYIAHRNNRIVGTLAAWDQRSFRQTHVEGYPGPMRFGRLFYNGLAKLTPLKPLPSPGSPVPHLYFSLVAVENDDSDIFSALLRHVYLDRRSGPWHYAMVGIHERSPLASCLSAYRQIPASGELYTVQYPDDESGAQVLDQRIPHIEIACL